MNRVIFIFLLLILVQLTNAAEVHVPSEYSTIQEALDNIQECDTILLDSGLYFGEENRNIEYYTPPYICFTILSEFSHAKATIDLEEEFFIKIYDTSISKSSHTNYSNGLIGVELTNLIFENGGTSIYHEGFDRLTIRNCEFYNNSISIMVGYPGTGIVMNSKFSDNDIGIFLRYSDSFGNRNNVFINNNTGAYYEGSYNTMIVGNIFTENYYGLTIAGGIINVRKNIFISNEFGIDGDYDHTYYCNDVFDNIINYYGIPDQTGINGNISEEPYFCDTTFETISVASISPLLPENNDCGVNIGNVTIGCYCGDVDVSGEINISDITYFVEYMFNNGSPPDPLEAGEINGDDEITISDLTYLVEYMFTAGSAPPCGF